MNYEYTETDHLLEPHRYMYTGYSGKPFLHAFFKDRQSFIPPEIRVSSVALDQELDRLFSLPVTGAGNGTGEDFHTTKQLLSIARNLLSGTSGGEPIDRFIRAFEVSRKLYDRYDREGKPDKQTSFDTLDNYALLSICCGLAFRSAGNLKLLNCQLKLNDTLSSCRKRFGHDTHLVSLCMVAILLEEQNVKALMKTSGVMV